MSAAPGAGDQRTERQTAARPRFASVVLDIDSTVAGMEGIDWLAARRGTDVAVRVAGLTDRAMRGEIALERVYGERLALIRPTRLEVEALAQEYVRSVAPGAQELLARCRDAGVRIALVSGGLREAILPLARMLGVPDDHLHAVPVRFDAAGQYAGIGESPLTTQQGKEVAVRTLALPAPVLAVGDGATDVAMRAVTGTLAAYTGFARRDAVIRAADHEIDSFPRLEALIFG